MEFNFDSLSKLGLSSEHEFEQVSDAYFRIKVFTPSLILKLSLEAMRLDVQCQNVTSSRRTVCYLATSPSKTAGSIIS